jgi:hypothetical protein
MDADPDGWPMVFRGLLFNGGFNAAYAAGRFAEALEFAQREYEAAKAFGESHYSLARSLNNRGLAFLELGELVKAEADFIMALQEIAEHKDCESEDLLPELEPLIKDHLQILRSIRAGNDKGRGPTTEADGSPERSQQQTLHNMLFPDVGVVRKVNSAWSPGRSAGVGREKFRGRSVACRSGSERKSRTT